MSNNNNKTTEIFNNVLTKDQFAQIEGMVKDFNASKKNLELEASFRNINYSNYMRISEHYVNLVEEQDISSSDALDVSINLDNGNTYRVSILGVDEIEQFLKKFTRAKPVDIQKYLLNLRPSKDIEIIYKDRGSADRLYVEDLGMVVKLTKETSDSVAAPKLTGNEKMVYRNKRRYSFAINDNVRVDITDVQESNNIWNLSGRPSNYEIEMEVVKSKISMNTFLEEIFQVMKVVQDTEFPIGRKEMQYVIQEYQALLGIKPSSHLDSRSVISIEVPHVVKFVPNKYAITDKADGERSFLFTTRDSIYLISMNLGVKKIGSKAKCQNLLLDGELIQNENGRMYMAFDVIYADGVDYRYSDKYTLPHRLEVLNGIIDKCFGNLIPFADYTDKNNDLEMDKIKTFYTKELKHYWAAFKKELSKSKNLFITRKVYFVPYGIDSAEVFMYADMIWKLSVYAKLTPYKLDGIIYTPISLPYMIRASPENYDSVPLEYKWKLPSQNSIDFFIKFVKDDNGNDAIFYDNAVVRADAKAYKICRLYVGITRGGQEKPVPFKVNGVEQKANIYLSDGDATDVEGNIIYDQTVVEFIFDNTKPDIDDAYKWIPLKTRYDKTESVQKYGKRYGNNLNIAVRIWRTIINPISEENIAALGNPLTFQREMDRLSKSVNTYNKQTFVYYQKRSGNAAGMRAFNNWIKSNMILTYCTEKDGVLDIGCGRGGDLLKFIQAGVREYVGVDIDNGGLYVISDSAYNRYKNFKRTNKNVPPMYFIHADARALFNVKSQEIALPNMTDFNKKLLEVHLSGNKKYDVINCQFSLHYYLSDEISWNNFCKNINNHLKDNGYVLITCFDGKLIHDRLIGKQKMTVSYADGNGRKNTFFEIVKIYNDTQKPLAGLGIAIDFYNSLISNPGTYNREFLVFPEFLEASFKKHAGLELIESDSFYNLFNLYRNYFAEDMGEFAVADTSSKQHDAIREFYLSLDPNNTNVVAADAALASFKLSMLNRYYIFKKTTPIDVSEPSRIVGVNHNINLGKVLTPYFRTNRMVIDPARRTKESNKIYHAIRKRYPDHRPTVYLIKHTIPEEEIDNEIYRHNKLQFSKIKEGSDPKILLIYKSPDKMYYPIYYQDIEYHDFEEPRMERIKQTYLLESDRIVEDLDMLVALSERL